MKPPITLLDIVEPHSNKEAAEAAIQHYKEWRAQLLKDFIEECEHDEQFLDRALKELRSLRGRGRTVPPYQIVMVECICNALASHRRMDIVEAIVATLGISTRHAERLHDAWRKKVN